jgi:hypothetical protein
MAPAAYSYYICKAEEELQQCKEPKTFEYPFAYLPAACNLVDAIRLVIC